MHDGAFLLMETPRPLDPHGLGRLVHRVATRKPGDLPAQVALAPVQGLAEARFSV